MSDEMDLDQDNDDFADKENDNDFADDDNENEDWEGVDIVSNDQNIIYPVDSHRNRTYHECWKCEECNIFLLVQESVEVCDGYCFRCNKSKFDRETSTISHRAYWTQPNSLFWTCWECKNVIKNIRSNYCIYGDCPGKNLIIQAVDIKYKPSNEEVTNDESRISIFNSSTYTLYHRLCQHCGSRSFDIHCPKCNIKKTKILYTNKMHPMIFGFIRKFDQHCAVIIIQIICLYFCGTKVNHF